MGRVIAMPLIMDRLPAIHWALAGAALGLITLLLFYLANVRLGVSGSFENVCALVSRQPFFRRAAAHPWRLLFISGLVLGGLLSRVLAGGWAPLLDMGMLDRRSGWSLAGKLAWMAAGGVLIGFGTRLAGGCTSGHGIFGNAHGERASVTSTLAFMLSGVVVTNLVYRVLFHG